MDARLKEEWNGFTEKVVRKEPATPRNMPPEYVMQPYAVRLSYNGQSWCTVDLEIGFNEIGDADESEFALSNEVADIFIRLGFTVPDSVPLMKCEHQIAQKLHGLTEPGSRRAHDLVDLQLIVEHSPVDYAKAAQLCRRLFSFRSMQSWPPAIVKGDDWETLYNDANFKHGVSRTIDEAIAWANELVRRIAES